jgi:hypothetical protein
MALSSPTAFFTILNIERHYDRWSKTAGPWGDPTPQNALLIWSKNWLG